MYVFLSAINQQHVREKYAYFYDVIDEKIKDQNDVRWKKSIESNVNFHKLYSEIFIFTSPEDLNSPIVTSSVIALVRKKTTIYKKCLMITIK